MLLALKMERELTKDEILELYLNKIFFGNRAYGVAAAAEFYYGKTLDQLTPGRERDAGRRSRSSRPAATRSSIPSARASRRNYVLQRMRETRLHQPRPRKPPRAPSRCTPRRTSRRSRSKRRTSPRWCARRWSSATAPTSLTSGYRVTTTIDRSAAGRRERRRCATAWSSTTTATAGAAPKRTSSSPADETAADRARAPAQYRSIAGLMPAASSPQAAAAAPTSCWPTAERRRSMPQQSLDAAHRQQVDRAQRPASRRAQARRRRAPAGRDAEAAPRFELDADARGAKRRWSRCIPRTARCARWSAASASRATSSTAPPRRSRQPGSSFKPFLYSAAFERGFTPASIVLDAPVVFRDRRRPRVAAAERQRQVRRPDAPARGAGAVAQPRLGAPARRDRRATTRASTSPTSASTLDEPAAEPVDVAGHRLADADLDGARLRGVRQWRLPDRRRTSSTRSRDRNGKVIFKRAAADAPAGCARSAWRRAQSPPPMVVDGFDFSAGGAAPRRVAGRDGRQAAPTPTPAALPAGHRARAARDRRAHRLPAALADARRGAARHRHRGQGARARRPRRQDRFDQRPPRRLVLRLRRRPASPRCGSAATISSRSATANTAARPRCRSGSTTCAWR